MPTILPAESYSGPPESPGSMPAFVSMRPCSDSEATVSSASVVMLWLSAVTVPAAARSFSPPSALPTPVTASDVFTVAEPSIFAVVRPLAFCNCSTATSSVGSSPTTFAV